MTEPIDHSSGIASVDGAQLYYEVAGTGAPLVFVHARMVDHRVFDAQFRAFASTRRVMRYDLRGYGRSNSPDGIYSHWKDLKGLCQHLALEAPAIVGLSMGAEIALSLALSEPSAVSRLLLCSSRAAKPELSVDLAARWAASDRAFAEGDIEKMIDLDIRDWVAGPQRDVSSLPAELRERVRTLYREIALRPRCGGEVKLKPSLVERLKPLSIPCTVVVGDRDLEDVQESSATLARGLNAKHLVVEDAGHLIPMEKPDVFNGIVKQFLDE
jgi:pimeloyl-ACP methyl ester carboxylesterase